MTENRPLAKPKFIKIKDLERDRSGYNVYAKVVSAEDKTVTTREGQKIPMVDCVLADETGSAKAFFKGENAALIQKGNVIAIRNGVKRYIKNFISLEVDLFGRVTLEKDVKVDANDEHNISTVEHKLAERPPRRQNNRRQRQGGYRGQRRDRDDSRDRRPRNDRRDDRPRRNNRDRDDDRDNRRQDRPRRNRDFDDREDRPRRNRDLDEREDRPRRNRDFDDREDRPRRNNNRDFDDRRDDRPTRGNRDRRDERREDRDDRRRRNNDRDFDRDEKPRNSRRQQYEEKPRREDRERRAPLTWTKIADVGPGDDNLNIIVKVKL